MERSPNQTERPASAAANALRAAFTEDHRRMTRGFHDLAAALRADDPAAAAQLADEIDRVAGPHIEFEETAYYPAAARVLGPDNVRPMYAEHRVGLGAIRRLLERDPQHPFTGPERAELLGAVETALDHAVSCGTMLGVLASLDDAELELMLGRLEEARQRGRRWSALPPRGG